MAGESMPCCDFDAGKLRLRMNVAIPADVTFLSPVVSGVMGFIREMKCAEGKEFEIETAIREALSNAIVHGCRNDPNQFVQFCVACDEERGMLIVVRDSGQGFDPASIPNPVVGQNIFSEHGRGIYLIHQFMDAVHFEKGGTEIRMEKR